MTSPGDLAKASFPFKRKPNGHTSKPFPIANSLRSQHFQKKILKNVLVVKADGSAPDASTPKSARGPKAKKSSVNGPSKEPKAKAITAPPRNNRKRKVDTQTADEEEQSSNPAKSVKVEQEAQEEERLDAEVDLEDGEKR